MTKETGLAERQGEAMQPLRLVRRQQALHGAETGQGQGGKAQVNTVARRPMWAGGDCC